jgi:hypothetical protein
MGQLGWDGSSDVYLFFSFYFSILAFYYWIILLYLHITKMLLRLTPYHLRDKKGSIALSQLIDLKTMTVTSSSVEMKL